MATKERSLDDDRNLMIPIMLKEESGVIDEADDKESERLQFRIDYQEIFISKFGGFKTEMDSKVAYAQAEF